LTKSVSSRRLRPLPQLRLTPAQPLRLLLIFERFARISLTFQHEPSLGNKVLPAMMASFGKFCSTLRKLLTDCVSRDELAKVWSLNAETVTELSAKLPALRTEKSEHYAEILSSLYRKQLSAFSPAQHGINKSQLTISEPRRVRDQVHLRPLQSNHVSYVSIAQPRSSSEICAAPRSIPEAERRIFRPSLPAASQNCAPNRR
jgi:hypothetical protein